MAIVDSLLKLVTVRGADALIMRAGEVPVLERGDSASKLSMPVPGDDIVQAILSDVASAPERGTLTSSGRLRTQYTCDATRFDVVVESTESGYHFAFRIASEAPAPPTPPANKAPATPVAASTAPATSHAQVESAYRGSGGALSVTHVLERATRAKASDILISAGVPPRLRVQGAIRAIDASPTMNEEIEAFFAPVLRPEDRKELDARGSCDIALDLGERRYRVNVFNQLHGLAAAFRPINLSPPSLSELHLPEDFKHLTRFRSGLVLMVGTTGSGKSTTLVALIEHLNQNEPKHIITLEDPIEYTYEAREALIHQREVGRHVASFATGLRAALRESPDVILVGEMRDHATISAALTAAETGHLVLSTLHSGSADMAIHRMVDVFPEHQQEQVRIQLADVLRAVVTQHLVPSTQPLLRVPAFERLMVTQAVGTKIRENRCHQIGTELQRGREDGMVPLELSLARLIKSGHIHRRTALELADDPTLVEQLAR